MLFMVIVGCYLYVRGFNWEMYLEIIEFGDSSIFCSSYRSLNLTTCLMFVEIIDLVGTSSPKLGMH
jgi:hypothetical protein